MEYINDNMIFGLDIGTRSIVGIVGVKEKKGFKVMASHVEMHETRSMIDGQIHDIEEVAQTITKVKNELESKLGRKLKKACIAAAGRVLKTLEITVDMEIEENIEISNKLIQSLELKGMERAMHQINFENGEEDMPFYCVGYTVTNYYLNDFIMKNLEGHKGNKIGAQVLSTFLPSEVVSSLYKVVQMAGLDVYSLTLEPIAAIEVAIPESYRLLNIALLDIGAGTSDIAITKGGSIVAYGMIPYAGDEITESIVHKYLVDFKTAETIKIKASGRSKTVTFKDAIGLKQTIDLEAVRETMTETKKNLAIHISKRIKELNGNHPTNAIFIVGGGGQIKGFEEILAKEIGLPKGRVAIRGKDVLSLVTSEDKTFKKLPEYVTPIGICLTGLENNQHDFVEVFLNDESIRVFNTNRLTVMDVVALKGINPKSFIGTFGKELTYNLNGVKHSIKGNPGEAARIYINQSEGGLTSPIKQHDYITILQAVDGETPKVSIKDLIGENFVKLNNQKKIINIEVRINKQKASYLARVKDGDTIEYSTITVGDLLSQHNVDYTHIFINELEKENSEPLLFGDSIVTFIDEYKLLQNNAGVVPKDVDDINELDGANIIEVVKEQAAKGTNNIKVVINNETYTMSGKRTYTFVDVFDYIDFDRTKVKGSLVTTINGSNCSYMDLIKNSDNIEVYWNNEN